MAAATNDGGIASKNMYELLGNDPDLDPDREPEPPTKAVDKPVARTGKRNAGADAPASTGVDRPAGGGRGGRHQVETRADISSRERGGNLSQNNRSRPVDDGLRADRHPDRTRGPNEHRDIDGRPRGSRGGRGYGGRGTRTGRDDRHSRTGVADHAKQAAHGWGDNSGEGEWADEKAGEAIAKQEEAGGWDTTVQKPVDADGNPLPDAEGPATTTATSAADNAGTQDADAEQLSNQKSYADYLAEQAQKKLELGGDLSVRKPNEGTKSKFPEGKAFERNEEDFFAGSGGKAKREREKKAKNFLDIDQSWNESAARSTDGGFRGGRGGGGGGRGRGRGEGGFRGEGRGRGRARGDRGEHRGDRGDRGSDGYRGRGGFRGGNSSGPNLSDSSAFPTLGSK